MLDWLFGNSRNCVVAGTTGTFVRSSSSLQVFFNRAFFANECGACVLQVILSIKHKFVSSSSCSIINKASCSNSTSGISGNSSECELGVNANRSNPQRVKA